MKREICFWRNKHSNKFIKWFCWHWQSTRFFTFQPQRWTHTENAEQGCEEAAYVWTLQRLQTCSHLHHHERLAVSAQRVLQQVGEAWVSERDVGVFAPQRVDDITKCWQRFVDALSFSEATALRPWLSNPLRACEVHKVQLPCSRNTTVTFKTLTQHNIVPV